MKRRDNKSNNRKKALFAKAIPTVLLLLIISAVAPLLIVNLLFMGQAPFSFFKAQYQASDLLDYAGTILAGFGTLVIGLATLCNSRQISEANRKIQNDNLRLQEEMKTLAERNTKRPFFIIDELLFDGITIAPNKSGNYVLRCHDDRPIKTAYMNLQNIGDGPAIGISLQPDSAFGTTPEKNRENKVCTQNGKIEIPLPIAPKRYSTDNFEPMFEIDYHNVVNSRFVQPIEIIKKEVYEERQIGESGEWAPEQLGCDVIIRPIGLQSNESLLKRDSR